MSNVEIGYAGIGVLLMLLALRVPIGVALISVSFGGMWMMLGSRAAWGALGIMPWNFTATWSMSSIPMFLMMGFLCFHAQLTKGLFECARLWLANLPGGLAIASVAGGAGFSAVTGSSVACAAAMGRIAVPEMVKNRYDPAFACATVAAAGTMGALIPPSILLILYGVIAQVQVGALFLGGVGVGLLTGLAYVFIIYVRVKINPDVAPRVSESVDWPTRIRALAETWPVIALMAGVLGGLFFGFFTPTEAGAVGTAFSMLIAMVKRTLTKEAIWNSVVETLQTTAAIFIIAIGASMLARFMAMSGTGTHLGSLVTAAGVEPVMLILGIIVLYLLLGMFLEPIGCMLLTLPILLPILTAAKIELLWFGLLLVKLLEMGMLTPPIGMNVFVIKSVVGNLVSTGRIFRAVIWFLAADAICIAVMMLFPQIVTGLPKLLL